MFDSKLGPVVTDLDGLELNQADIDILQNQLVGGIILFARNYSDPIQLRELTASIKDIRPDVLISVDQEGGRVQRFREGFTRLPSMQAAANYCDEDLCYWYGFVEDLGWLMASEVIAHGVDLSYAPVLDLDDNKSKAIGDRSFSADWQVTVEMAKAFMSGMKDAGMSVTGKHFPGHGAVVCDSHMKLPVDYRTYSEVIESDLKPFITLLPQLDAMMPAHILYPDVDPDQPVGFSKKWVTDILKLQMGFDGVVFSDDLTMQGAASSGNYSTRARLAIEAGVDALIVCNDRPGSLEILDYLSVNHDLVKPSRLERVKSRAKIDISQLKASERWSSTREKIDNLNAKNGAITHI